MTSTCVHASSSSLHLHVVELCHRKFPPHSLWQVGGSVNQNRCTILASQRQKCRSEYYVPASYLANHCNNSCASRPSSSWAGMATLASNSQLLVDCHGYHTDAFCQASNLCFTCCLLAYAPPASQVKSSPCLQTRRLPASAWLVMHQWWQ